MAISHEDTLLLFLLLFSIIDRVCVFLVLLSSFLLAAVAFFGSFNSRQPTGRDSIVARGVLRLSMIGMVF
jgi:hypothetical protein